MVRTTELEIQLTLRMLPDFSIFPNPQLVDALPSHQKLVPKPMHGQLPDKNWSTSGLVNSCEVSPKVGCVLWSKRPTLTERGMKPTFSKLMVMADDDLHKNFSVIKHQVSNFKMFFPTDYRNQNLIGNSWNGQGDYVVLIIVVISLIQQLQNCYIIL